VDLSGMLKQDSQDIAPEAIATKGEQQPCPQNI
jgi:hypothetical protein